MWYVSFEFGTWPLMDPPFQNGAMDARTFYVKMKKNQEPARTSEVAESIRTVRGQGKNGKGKHEVQSDSADIYINPPIDDSEGDYESSDTEDDVELSNKFSSKILSATADASLKYIIGEKWNTEETDKEDDDYSSEENDEPASKKPENLGCLIPRTVRGQKGNWKCKERWRNGDFAKKLLILQILKVLISQFRWNYSNYSWDVDLFQYVKVQTNLFASERKHNNQFQISNVRSRVVTCIAVLIRVYEILASRKLGLLILKFIHSSNNNTEVPTGDKFRKIRPLLQHLNRNFSKYAQVMENVDVDVLYCTISCKQRIQGKPIRYIIKFSIRSFKYSIRPKSGHVPFMEFFPKSCCYDSLRIKIS
ncbi:hypothetical protein HHI36_005171 [Cryptolaemus montrouzieri]|uniref:PiggyBac transposable element-derived protein domain-containing protein n=1 Tax=Cryptolaemus montrouzieri TaxID=559131 RepID=A0ABD2NTG1_9CUCU